MVVGEVVYGGPQWRGVHFEGLLRMIWSERVCEFPLVPKKVESVVGGLLGRFAIHGLARCPGDDLWPRCLVVVGPRFSAP